MAIEKKLIHFGKLADFEAQLTAGNILNRSIVFIQDAKKIWTHGTYYDCSGCSDVDLSDYLTAEEIAEVYATIEALNGKQDALVSGTNIKTINGESIVGSGDIVIEGGATLTEADIAAMGFTKNTGTYSKPSGGIPKTDLASAVQTSLGKADTALQAVPSGYATETYVNNTIASAITTTLNTAV